MNGFKKETVSKDRESKRPNSERGKTKKAKKAINESLNLNIKASFLEISESSEETISRIIKSIKRALILGSIASFLWTLKGPEDLPGAVLDKSPWIRDKHAEYKNREKAEEEWAYVPILKRELKEVTAYVPEDPRQTDSDPKNASCGEYEHLLKKGINIIAVSRDIFFDKEAKRMLKRGKPLCGLPAVVRLKNGEEIRGIIMDTMNPRFSKKADLGISVLRHGGSLEKANEEALKFGKKEAKELIVFLPIKKESLVEAIMKERMKGKLKKLLESSLSKRANLSRKS